MMIASEIIGCLEYVRYFTHLQVKQPFRFRFRFSRARGWHESGGEADADEDEEEIILALPSMEKIRSRSQLHLGLSGGATRMIVYGSGGRGCATKLGLKRQETRQANQSRSRPRLVR